MSNVDHSQSASCGDDLVVGNDIPSTSQQVESEEHTLETTSADGNPKRGRKRVSSVWEYFIEITSVFKGKSTPSLQCIYCRRKFHKSKTGTTSQLLRHVKECEKHASCPSLYSRKCDVKGTSLAMNISPKGHKLPPP